MAALTVDDLSAGYGKVQILHNVSFQVKSAHLVAVLGLNGAGKSTLLRALSGLTTMMGGRISLGGDDVSDMKPETRASMGLAHVPENRRIFPELSIRDNLLLGGYVARTKKGGSALEEVCELFPILGQRSRQLAGSLSGGQQQMLAIGMGLMARPRVLMLDEPSLGLAPLFVANVYDAIKKLQETGLTILLVEQLGEVALDVADEAVVLGRGGVVGSGDPSEVRRQLAGLYMGA